MTYLRFDASSLPGLVGKDGPNGTRLSDGRAGHISFGPYLRCEAGKYIAGFYLTRTNHPSPLTFDFDVTAAGDRQLARRSIRHADLFDDVPTLVFTTFEVFELTDGIEVRLYVPDRVDIEIHSLVILQSAVRIWSGL